MSFSRICIFSISFCSWLVGDHCVYPPSIQSFIWRTIRVVSNVWINFCNYYKLSGLTITADHFPLHVISFLTEFLSMRQPASATGIKVSLFCWTATVDRFQQITEMRKCHKLDSHEAITVTQSVHRHTYKHHTECHRGCLQDHILPQSHTGSLRHTKYKNNTSPAVKAGPNGADD